MSISVKGWKRFQHFRDRRPPWIKLYRDLLEDPDWHELSGDDAKHLMMLWLIASEDEGRLPDIRKIAFRLRINEEEAAQLVKRLSRHWLDVTVISDRYHYDFVPASNGSQNDTPEREGETETEGETESYQVGDDS